MSQSKKLNDDAEKEKPLYEKPKLTKLEDVMKWSKGGLPCSVDGGEE